MKVWYLGAEPTHILLFSVFIWRTSEAGHRDKSLSDFHFVLSFTFLNKSILGPKIVNSLF